MIKAVIFDFDGTLANTLSSHLRAYHNSLKMIGFSLSDREVVERCLGKKEEVICASLGVPKKTGAVCQAVL